MRGELPAPSPRLEILRWPLRLLRLLTNGSTCCLLPILCLLLAFSAQAENAPTDLNGTARGLSHINVLLRYDFRGDVTGENLAPEVFVNGQATFWRDAPGTNRLVLRYGADLSLFGELESRADFAKSLLIPGNASIAWGAAYEHGNAHGVRFLGPEVSVSANAIAWGDDAFARQLAFKGGAMVSLDEVFGLALQVGRAVNGIGDSDRRRVLAALGGPGSWATYLSTAAEVHLSPADLRCFAAFGAYLGDSKFSVVPNGRRILSVGIKKEL